MKKISFLFAFLCASVISFAQESVVASCDFTAQTAKHTAYNDTWTYGDWSVYGAANNNGGWTYAKFGGKQTTLANANPCYIFGLVNQPVTKIVVTTNAGNLKAGSVKEWGVKVYSDAQKTNMIANVKGGTMTKSKSEALELIPTADAPWAGKSYYQVYFDLANTSTTNGIVWIDKIEFYAAPTEDVPATAITIDKTALSIENYKNTVALTATVTPDNATDEIVWTSANEEIATISKMGVITALKEGTVTLTATAGSVSATCELTVTAPTVLTCAQAAEKAAAVTNNNEIAAGGKYVIRGYMTKEAGKGFASDLAQYNNISFWMSDERGGANVFEAYQVLPLDKENLPEIGDLVELVGDITKYGTTYETVGKGSATMTIIEKAPIIPATAIEMSEIGLNMTVGETFTLTVTVTPEDASLEGLTWTSSDETLATVKDGVVTAVAPTPAYEYVTITATLGELTATCDVAIYATLESIKFNTTEMDTEFEFEEGLEIPLTFDIQPENASTDGIIVTSNNTAVATITEQSFFGMTFFTMNVVGIGTTTLKVTTADGKLSDELVITVTPPAVHATAITVDKEALTLNVGDTYQLVATMTPEDAVDVIEWNSSKAGVATVENGLVTAVGVGEATIWITAGWEASATCKVTVNDKGTGLENIAELDTNAPIYNVLGQEVSAEYKGVVIQNGKKFLLQ